MSKHSHSHGSSGNSGGGTGNGASVDGKSPAGAQGTGDGQENPREKTADNGDKSPEILVPDFVESAAEAKTTTFEAELANRDLKTAELEAKLAELNDQYLRKAADFENFRKRMNKEKQELTEFANQNLLSDLLPMIDDFERAIKSAETSQDFASFFEGIVMIEKRLSTQLDNKWGLKRFDSEGQPFDPNFHEAIQMEKKPGITEAVVQEDYLKGYMLKDRVLRFAKVKVLVPEGNAASAGGQSGASGEGSSA